MAAENKLPDGWSPGEGHRFDLRGELLCVCVRARVCVCVLYVPSPTGQKEAFSNNIITAITD